MPKKVTIGDIAIRDGCQHEEKFITTAAKIFYGQESILAGCRELEATNLGSPEGIPQFRDADQVMQAMRSDGFKKRCARAKIDLDRDVTLSCVTIREPAVDRAIEMKKKGYGPDRILMMVSTDPVIEKAAHARSTPPEGDAAGTHNGFRSHGFSAVW